MADAVEIDRFSARLPDAERYNLTTKLPKAVTSAPVNMAEGAGCSSTGAFARFLGDAYRSLKEFVTGL